LSDQDGGFDIKYSVTPSLTLDATYNTDFAQVEVDEFQINLDRFSLFLPEQRPFFLENSAQFTVGDPGEMELFFSRRIGIAGDGSAIPSRVACDSQVKWAMLQTWVCYICKPMRWLVSLRKPTLALRV
jgi:hypothetical protein